MKRDFDPFEPADLAARLTELFPPFAAELVELDGPCTLHAVVLRLTPRITGYLEVADPKKIKAFCELVNVMAQAGGDAGNAIATCLLEHASQVRVRKIIAPHLRSAAKKELR